MMKKLFLLLGCFFAFATLVMADNTKPIQLGQLPTPAQTFITTHFKNHKVAFAKVETEFLSKTYEVIFTNGEKVEFDRSGGWIEVQCKTEGVPAAIIPAAIRDYVEQNYPETIIQKIERDKHDIEVQLSNHWEIKFDHEMRVIEIDD